MMSRFLLVVFIGVLMPFVAVAQTDIAHNVLDKTVVENNSSQIFDAKGFAVALVVETNAKKVVVKSAQDSPLYTTFQTKVPGTDMVLTHLTHVDVSVSLDDGDCLGSGAVYIGKDINGTQIAAVKSSGLRSFKWTKSNGQNCTPFVNGTKVVVLHSETQRLTFEALAK